MMTTAAGHAQRAGHEAQSSGALRMLVRVGLASYGVVHLLIGWLALQLALGDNSGAVSRTGALRQLAQDPVGRASLWVVGIGLAALVLWQLAEAAVGHQWEEGGKRWAKRGQSLFRAVVYGTLAWTALKIAAGAGSGGGKGTDTWTAKLMRAPLGQWLVGLVGLAIVAYGVWTVVKGWTDRWEKHLDKGSGRREQVITVAARVGYTGRGVALGTVGGLFVWAAMAHDADKSGGMDQAMGTVLKAPGGPLLLALVALGLACYGVFCFAWARYFRE